MDGSSKIVTKNHLDTSALKKTLIGVDLGQKKLRVFRDYEAVKFLG